MINLNHLCHKLSPVINYITNPVFFNLYILRTNKNKVHWRDIYILMKSFTLFTMKSKHVWMKSKLYSFDEIKSAFYPCEARFHHKVISSALADLSRRKTDLVEKSTCSLQVLFLAFGYKIDTKGFSEISTSLM